MRPVTAVFWAAAMSVLVQQSASAPDSFVDLSSKNLSFVPKDLPHTVEHLDLSCNHIRQLDRGDFGNTKLLRFLNVSWNLLERIDTEAFMDTSLLEELDLSHNQLINLEEQQYLQYTGNVRALHLDHNRFVNMTLGKEFSLLNKMEKLSLGARQISRGDFKQISDVKLNTLSLSLGNEFNYEAGSLQDIHAEKFQISFLNKQKIYHNLLSDALSFFDKVELINLTKDYQELIKVLSEQKEIRTSHFYLTNIVIQWKDLTHYINAALHTPILHLTSTDVAMTNLPFIETDVAKTSKVRSFTAVRAVVKSFLFSQEAVYSFFINMPVQTLAIVETSLIHMTCPKSQSPIQHLNFSFCALSDSIFSSENHQQTIECENLSNVKRLTLVDNNLKSLQSLSKRVQYMSSLEHLDVSLNILVYDGLEECVWPPNISNMILSFNSLTDSVFKCLPKRVRILDLENNEVTVVPSSIMKLENLLLLNLNANRLRDLPVCNGFPLLNELLLKSNSLHAPSVSNLEKCHQLKTLDISHNPFTCTCAIRGFRKLGVKSERNSTVVKLTSWPSEYYCLYPEALRNTTLREASIADISCNTGLLAATILCPAVFVIIAIVSVCHRLDVPWYMSMLWQWVRAKHRSKMQAIRPEDLVGVEFHAFVSYSQHNADWVNNSLLPNLSELRICHHERHFMPGKTIIENIMSCVQKSRRFVFVLSSHFVKSEWCHYELYFATHQQLAWGPDSVVLVLLEPVPQYLIPNKYNQLKSMMRRHTYIEWPQDKAKQRLFWANLRAALQSELPLAPAAELEE